MVPLSPIPTSPAPLTRLVTSVLPPSDGCPSFKITAANRSYKHQYANIYFVRLRFLREFVEEAARRRWINIVGSPVLVPRVLEVVKSQLCYIIGTVYMEMPLKPNVLEDIARDHSIPPPPILTKFYSPEDGVMLEDESGRIQLVGEPIKNARLVTGVIIGVLGAETPNGDFEVVDICYAGLAPQSSQDGGDREPEDNDAKMDVDDADKGQRDEWIALISGLSIDSSSSSSDGQIQMLVEYLTGEEGGLDDQVAAADISRLIVVGNSLAPVVTSEVTAEERKPRRYGYDSTNFSPHPTISLSGHLLDIGRTMPVHILPGPADPSGVILPQQPFPRAMLGAVSAFPTFSCETNPTYLRLGVDPASSSAASRPAVSRTLLIHSGQPLDDMFKYLPSPPATRLSILESTLKWRHMAPTAPDTLWCHPYFATDPFLIKETPDIYIVGQKKFGTKLVRDNGESDAGSPSRGAKKCRIIMVPAFAETGMLVLVNLRTLKVKTVKFAVRGMTGAADPVE